MPSVTKDNSITDHANEKNTLGRSHAHIQHHSLYDDDTDDYQHYQAGDEDGYEDDEDLPEDDESVLSIPDPNINFDLVYALHTFAASVDGQTTVVKGDALTLLDDTNSYWWLVKVLKTSEIGYIPAENIETPYERLARLNSHRNIELTRRDIQDAFPAPPSNKSSSTKKVTLAKGVKFQAQVIIGSSDDEDFEEEYEEWHENMLSSESNSEGGSSYDDDDEYEYMDDKDMYAADDYHDGVSEADTYKPGYQQQKQSFYQQPQQHQQYHFQQQQSESQPRPEPASQQQPELQPRSQPQPQLQPQLQAQPHQLQQSQSAQQKYQLPTEGGRSNENQTHLDDTLTENKNGRSFAFRDTLDLEQTETIKISLTPSIARGSEDSAYHDSEAAKLKKQSKFERLLNNDASTQPTRHSKEKEKKEKSGIRKFFSRNKDSKDKKKKSADKDSISETASFSSQSTGYSDRERAGSIESMQREDPQPAMLKIFAGNILFGAEYKVAHAYESTTAAELIQQATESFDIEGYHGVADKHQDYYLTVKGIDGDVYTLVPSDKPLAIYHSLTTHLNTPMPSLKKARRISQLMSTTEATHMGGPKNDVSETEEVRFYLHSKARRIDEKDGQVSIKASLFATEVDGATSILKPDQSRADKMVYVTPNALISDVTNLLLQKFHVLNGVVDGVDVDEKIRSLRLQGTEVDAVKYRLTVSRQGQEYLLSPTAPISSAFGDNQPPVHYRRSSNPDRSSVTSTSSTILAPRPEETFFILRRSHQAENGYANMNNRPVRPHRPTRQNTPMPRREPIARDITPSQPMPQVHPLENQNRAMSASPVDTMVLDPAAPSSTVPAISDEPEEAKDMLLKLDEALDHLEHTRNSNESLTEAITNQMTVTEAALEGPGPRKNRNGAAVESMLFCDDFGMEELMVMIRGAARLEDESLKSKQMAIRSEINEIYKESQMRLDQVEKELDRLMLDAVRVYF
ncbi:hypothetical protein EC973_004407 [Apophysomyces ossiformis]|uniref:SH3 domain-containing protein n=1 Tax=Apophysomyces ossiformis TaxID=679940 RepID=A0A8H7EUW5_9FUNG|nr:hypothetical protein EC973_004407 [Apophysomyces ossiformis]